VSKPTVHAMSSARKFGGHPEDYLPIHDFMDSSKGAFADNRHRALTHNAWFIAPDGPLERSFGKTLTNAEGREVSVRDIGEQHIIEDFGGYIPTAQDFLQFMDFEDWMNNGKTGFPPSQAKIAGKGSRQIRRITFDVD
jgi:hypothetical protein